MSENISELAKALSVAQGTLENVSKDSSGYGYKYASLANCLESIRQPLKDNGLSISQIIENSQDNKLLLVTYLLHVSGQWIKSIFPIQMISTTSTNNNKSNPMQILGSAITYARRYSLAAIIGLAQTDDDADKVNNDIPSDSINLIKGKILTKCYNAGINPKEFGAFANLTNQPIDVLNKVLQNFNEFAMKFKINAEEANDHDSSV